MCYIIPLKSLKYQYIIDKIRQSSYNSYVNKNIQGGNTMQTATLIISPETIRQTLRVEKEHWIKLKQFFNVNHELIETFAGEQFYSIGCFAGLLSFIACNRKYKASHFSEFMEFERNNRKYASTISKIGNISTLSQQQLRALCSYLMRRSALVESFVNEVFYNIYNPPAKEDDQNGNHKV